MNPTLLNSIGILALSLLVVLNALGSATDDVLEGIIGVAAGTCALIALLHSMPRR